MDQLDSNEIRKIEPAHTTNSVIREDTGGQETQTRNRRQLRRSRRVSFESPETQRIDMRTLVTGAHRTQEGWVDHVSHQKVKVHVELNPAALEDILDDCDFDRNVGTIYEDAVGNEQDDILEVEVNNVLESDNEEEWESNDLSSSTSDDDFTLDHVMQKWGVE